MADVRIYTDKSACEFDATPSNAQMCTIPPTIAASTEVGRWITAEPIGYILDNQRVEKESRAILSGRANGRCFSAVHAGDVTTVIKWETRDIQRIAKKLMSADAALIKRLAMSFWKEENWDTAAKIFQELAKTKDGAKVAGKIAFEVKDFNYVFAILVRIPNPAASARIVNFLESYFESRDSKALMRNSLAMLNEHTVKTAAWVRGQQQVGVDGGSPELTQALVRSGPTGDNDGDAIYRYEMIHMYLAATDDANTADELGRAALKDQILEIFAKYHDSGRGQQEEAELGNSLEDLKDRKVIEDYKVGFDKTNGNRVSSIEIKFSARSNGLTSTDAESTEDVDDNNERIDEENIRTIKKFQEAAWVDIKNAERARETPKLFKQMFSDTETPFVEATRGMTAENWEWNDEEHLQRSRDWTVTADHYIKETETQHLEGIRRELKICSNDRCHGVMINNTEKPDEISHALMNSDGWSGPLNRPYYTGIWKKKRILAFDDHAVSYSCLEIWVRIDTSDSNTGWSTTSCFEEDSEGN